MFSSDLSALGVPGFAMAPPDFERSVNPILTMQGGRLCPPYYDIAHPDFQACLRHCS